jgi:hypothetical protein
LNQGFPGFLAEFHDVAGDPGKPQKHPQSPHRMEMKWKWKFALAESLSRVR